LKIYNFADGASRVIAAPDPITLVAADWNKDYYVSVVLKPTAAFAADPLFETISATEFYQQYVGQPWNANPSVE